MGSCSRAHPAYILQGLRTTGTGASPQGYGGSISHTVILKSALHTSGVRHPRHAGMSQRTRTGAVMEAATAEEGWVVAWVVWKALATVAELAAQMAAEGRANLAMSRRRAIIIVHATSGLTSNLHIRTFACFLIIRQGHAPNGWVQSIEEDHARSPVTRRKWRRRRWGRR